MTLLPIHILAGSTGIISGFVALSVLKGGKVHRKAGMIFVYAMLTLSATGAVIAATKGQRINFIAGCLTFYLVTTALLTVRRRVQGFHWTNVGAMLVGLTTALFAFKFGFDAMNSPTGTLDGLPPPPAFMFGVVGLIAAYGDLRMMRAGGLQGADRIARHLWRMTFAMWIATSSFFLGQAKVFPEPIRIMPLLAAPVLLVFLVLIYWLVRVRRQGEPRAYLAITGDPKHG
jgi:uncharacterized membrane protein